MMNSISRTISVPTERNFLTQTQLQPPKRSIKLAGVNLLHERKRITLCFRKYPNKGRLYRKTLFELETPGLYELARQGKKDPLYFGAFMGETGEPDPSEIQISECCFLKSYPRLTEMGWIMGIIGAGKMSIYDGPRSLNKYSSPRRNSDLTCRRGNLFFRNNDTFITVSDLDKRRSVFPNEGTLMRYQHFFRSYPLKPNKKRREHWVWGEKQHRYSLI